MVDRNTVVTDVDMAAENTALVIVDMENEFLKPGFSFYLGAQCKAVIANTATLLQRCRDAGVPVIYVRSVRYDDDPLFTRFGCSKYLIEGTDSPVIVEELRPLPGETVIEKHTHDCFHNTEMDATLERLRILPETHELIVTGVASNVCVYHAVLGFHVRHYRTVVALDCTAGARTAEEFVIGQLSGPGYNYNVKLSTSHRINITANASTPT